MQSITPVALRQKLKENESVILIDVRESFEREAFNIGGIHIPMQDVFARVNEIPSDNEVVVYCRKGVRSMIVIQRLSEKFGFQNLINLEGGMDAWIKEIQ